jgi:uncharacterized protein (TIGR03435 family)
MIARTLVGTCLIAIRVMGQAAPTPHFEVAVVRVAAPRPPDFQEKIRIALENNFTAGALRSGNARSNQGLVTLRYVNLRWLTEMAFEEVLSEDYLKGAPGWFDSDFFDLIAKPPPGTSVDDERFMIQSVLMERFHLSVHREQRPMPVFGLVVSKRGAKLQPPTGKDEPNCKTPTTPGERGLVCRNATLAFLARNLNYPVNIGPVVDFTDITGTYDFDLAVPITFPDNQDSRRAGFFEALGKQLGLRVENRKVPMPVIVIDHVDRVPTDN